MKLIFAQGNPGNDYEHTRHNVGFMALDYFTGARGATFQPKTKFRAEITELTRSGERVLFVKPSTFYNETGISARALVDFYKLDTTDILVIHDDLALPIGTLRAREKGSGGGNNGIKSLNAHIGENYARLRIGIWSELASKISSVDFVLSRLTKVEQEKLRSDVLPKVSELIDNFIQGDYTPTSHKL